MSKYVVRGVSCDWLIQPSGFQKPMWSGRLKADIRGLVTSLQKASDIPTEGTESEAPTTDVKDGRE